MNLKDAKKLVMGQHHKMYLAEWDGFWVEWRGNRLIYCGPKRTQDPVQLGESELWLTEQIGRTADEVTEAMVEMTRFIDAGYTLFPIVADKKMPRDLGWRGINYSGFMQGIGIRDWLRAGGNVAVRLDTDDLVIDIDPRHKSGNAEESVQFLEWVIGEHIDVQDRPRVYSGRGDGGRHIFMKKPPDIKLRSLPSHTYPGIDVKRFGGFVVCAGSKHVDTGGMYRLQGNISEVRAAPDELVKLLTRPPSPPRTGEGGEFTCEEARQMLSFLDAKAFRDPEDFINMAMAVHDGTNGEALPEWLDWCASDPAYGDDARAANELRWESFEAGVSGGRTFKTLLRAVVLAGHKDYVGNLSKTFAADDFDDDPDGNDMPDEVDDDLPFGEEKD